MNHDKQTHPWYTLRYTWILYKNGLESRGMKTCTSVPLSLNIILIHIYINIHIKTLSTSIVNRAAAFGVHPQDPNLFRKSQAFAKACLGLGAEWDMMMGKPLGMTGLLSGVLECGFNVNLGWNANVMWSEPNDYKKVWDGLSNMYHSISCCI